MNCIIPKAKIYSDGSHFIAKIPGYYKGKKKGKNKEYLVEVDGKTIDLKEVFNIKREENLDVKKKERDKAIIEELAPIMGGVDEAKAFVEMQNARVRRNLGKRMDLLHKRVRILYPNYFCTFTYDSSKVTAEQFRKKLMQTLYNFSSRYGWKYVGAWEEGGENGRIHFHALIRIPEGQMVGELYEVRDYDTRNHKMRTSYLNSYFTERFGRTDFQKINEHVLTDSVMYLVKYIEKSGKRLVFARGVLPFIEADILVEDIICTLGEDNPGKVILADDFLCIQDGEVLGRACPEIIDKMRKTN